MIIRKTIKHKNNLKTFTNSSIIDLKVWGLESLKKYSLMFAALLLITACSNKTATLDKEGSAEEQPEEITEVVGEVEQEEDLENDSEEKEEEPEEVSSDDSDEMDDEEITWDDVKNHDNIIGKSDKDYLEISDQKPSEVRNDVTGNWRKSTISENVDIQEYLLSYEDLYMQEDEVHFIINFNYNTTTVVNKFNGLLFVDINEYVEKEEHDADTLGNGMLLKSYIIYPDGDIEEVEG